MTIFWLEYTYSTFYNTSIILIFFFQIQDYLYKKEAKKGKDTFIYGSPCRPSNRRSSNISQTIFNSMTMSDNLEHPVNYVITIWKNIPKKIILWISDSAYTTNYIPTLRNCSQNLLKNCHSDITFQRKKTMTKKMPKVVVPSLATIFSQVFWAKFGYKK